MPQIPTFDAGVAALRPTETGTEAVAGAARRVGMFYNQQAGAEEKLARETERLGAQTADLGNYKANLLTGEGARLGSAVAAAGDAAVKVQEHREKNQGAAAFAAMLQQSTDDWNNTVKNADPNDPTLKQKFMQQLEPQLQQFKSGFITDEGQQYAEAHIDALRQHFAEKTTADMSTLAGLAARNNIAQTINSLSSTVHDDPSSVKFALAALKSTAEGVIGSSPNMTGPEAAQVREEILQKGAESIVKSAAIGYIARTGQVPAWVSDPAYSGYVNGQELQIFARQARTQQHYDAVAQKQGALLQGQLDEQNVARDLNKNFGDNVTFDPATNRAQINPQFFRNALDIVRKYPNAPNAATVAKTYLDWGQSKQRERNEPVVSDPGVRKDLMDRMFSADNPTTRVDILRAEADHKLSAHDATSMHELTTELEQSPLKGPMWEDTMKAAHAALTYSMPGMPGKDPKGEQAFASFVQNFIPDYLRKARAGTLPPDALNMNDPNSLISKSLSQFQRSPTQRLQDRIGELGGIGEAPAAASTPPAVGEVRSGYRFKGGDPAKRESWEKL